LEINRQLNAELDSKHLLTSSLQQEAK